MKSVENECVKRTYFSKEKFKVQIRKLNKNVFFWKDGKNTTIKKREKYTHFL